MKRWAMVLACAGAAACSHEGPVSGELSVRMATIRSTDRAVLFRVVGPQHGVTAATGSTYRVFSDTSAVGDTAWVMVVAPSGSGVVAGDIARLAVNDVRKAGDYRVMLLDVAAASYAVGDTANVTLTVVKP